MNIQSPDVKLLLSRYEEIQQLEHIQALLGWDQNTYMPIAAANERARQSALLAQYLSQKWNEPKLKSVLESLADEGLNDDERDLVRVFRERAKFYLRVPEKLVMELSQATGEAFSVWHEARTNDDFAQFAPYLKTIIKLQQTVAGHLGYQDDPYDALLDLHEPQLTYKQAHGIFAKLQQPLTAMIRAITTSAAYEHAQKLHTSTAMHSQASQEALSHHMMGLMGYPTQRGRLDVSPHPFTTTLGFDDVRITTRYDEHDWLSSYSSTIHEAGHALYELGIDSTYRDTPFATGVSLGVHESQSRFWENMIGKNPGVLAALYPALKQYLGDIPSQKDLSLYANFVRPGFIRVEADEVTYNLHILLRMELEHALIHDELLVDDLPRAWREKMKSYLGVEVKTDREGCLQDVHWSYGSFGYFPTYTIGNLYSASLLTQMQKDVEWDRALDSLDFVPVRQWLGEHIHQYGARYTPTQLMQKAGISLGAEDYLHYITNKYSALYDLSL